MQPTGLRHRTQHHPDQLIITGRQTASDTIEVGLNFFAINENQRTIGDMPGVERQSAVIGQERQVNISGLQTNMAFWPDCGLRVIVTDLLSDPAS